MNAFIELLPYWLLLSGLCFSMVYGGGIDWMHRNDIGRFSSVPVAVWKKIHHVIWMLGTGVFVLGNLLS
ncbi:MAG: hypothetical protein ABI790_09020 [Betaproteobacteria bacterium]